MVSNWLNSRVFVPLSLALCLSGCPSSCQQRREIKQAGGERIEIKLGKAEIEQQKQTTARRAHKITKRLRSDGTPWEIIEEKDDEVSTLEIDRELVQLAEEASMRWHNNSDKITTRPWWYWPVVGLIALAFLAAAAWYVARRFFGGR